MRSLKDTINEAFTINESSIYVPSIAIGWKGKINNKINMDTSALLKDCANLIKKLEWRHVDYHCEQGYAFIRSLELDDNRLVFIFGKNQWAITTDPEYKRDKILYGPVEMKGDSADEVMTNAILELADSDKWYGVLRMHPDDFINK